MKGSCTVTGEEVCVGGAGLLLTARSSLTAGGLGSAVNRISSRESSLMDLGEWWAKTGAPCNLSTRRGASRIRVNIEESKRGHLSILNSWMK